MEKNLTSGSVFKNILYFSLPYLLSYFLQTLYGMADLYIIGQFNGVGSITAVSVGSQVMHMLTVMIVGLAMGSTVMIGQAVGAKKMREASETIGNTVTLFMLLSVAATGLLLVLVKPIVAVMSTPKEAVSGTAAYLTICFIGIPFITAYNIISSVFRGLGDSKSPMYFIAVACAVNIGLDYLFIGILRLGAAGAALGTTLAQTVSVIAALLMIRRKKSGLALLKSDFRLRRSIMQKVLRIGIPVALQDGLIQIAFIVITVIANRRGINDAAAVGIVEKVIGVVFLVPSSMLSTVSALSAQNIGAGKHDRAALTLRYAVLITAGFGILVTAAVWFWAEPIIGIFVKEKNTEVIRLGSTYIRGYIGDCIFAGIHFCFSGFFCAYGRSGISFLHNFAAIIIVRVPGAYFGSKLFTDTLFPMGLAAPGGSLLSVMICIAAYFYLRKRLIRAANGGMTKMTEVKFYENAADELLKFAVIISKTQNQYVFCKHKDRDTWEVPGGHREQGENIIDTAKRELYEETGALEFDMEPVCVYSVTAPDNYDGRESFGMLFFADIKCFEAELHSEIEKIAIMDELPERWTYPDIQPHLIEEAGKRGYL